MAVNTFQTLYKPFNFPNPTFLGKAYTMHIFIPGINNWPS